MKIIVDNEWLQVIQKIADTFLRTHWLEGHSLINYLFANIKKDDNVNNTDNSMVNNDTTRNKWNNDSTKNRKENRAN